MQPKIALVTGANRGIGFEVCRQLLELGYVVYLGARDREKGEKALTKMGADISRLRLLELDVLSLESIERAKLTIEKDFGHLDVLINNAAIHYDDWEDVLTLDLKILHEAFETNTVAPLVMTQHFLPLIKKSSSPRIVNVSSEAGSFSCLTGRTPAYTLTKYALNALTVMLAHQLKNEHILVNAVCPGWTNTDMGKGGRPVPDGAKGVVWAATLPDEGPTGGFFKDGRAIEF